MTSKEALEHICKTCDNKSCPWKHYEKSRCAFYGVIKQDLGRLEKVEKDLKQTKSNFKNSQTHSRNCYKKLLDRYMGLEKENTKLKKSIEILNKYPKMINDSVRFDSPYGIQLMLGVSKEEAEEIKKGYRLLKEVLDNVD